MGLNGHKLNGVICSAWYIDLVLPATRIKAGKLIVPERIGRIYPKDIAKEVIFLMNNKRLLEDQKFKLSEQRGNDGAAKKLVELILKSIS